MEMRGKLLGKRMALVLMLTMVFVPVIPIAAANGATLTASGIIGVGAFLSDPLPVPPMPLPPGYDSAILAADTYHFDTFVLNGFDMGSFDLVVVYMLIYDPPDIFHGIPLPIVAYTNAPAQSPIPALLGAAFSASPLFDQVYVTDDLTVNLRSLRGRGTQVMSVRVSVDDVRVAKLRYRTVGRTTMDPDPMPISEDLGLVLDIGSGRMAIAGGRLQGHGFVLGVGLVSTFSMFTIPV